MRYLFHGLIRLLTLICLFLVTSANAADEAQGLDSADLAWSEFDGKGHSIWFSSWQQDSWAQPQRIIDDHLINIHPQVDAAANGNRLIVWTSIDDGLFSLRYSQQKDTTWSEPKTIPTELASNIAPSVLYDNQNVGWIVWAGNNGTLDDIYFSRLIDGIWQPPQCIHPANNVPDILPQLSRDESGRIQVTWQSYHEGAYQFFYSTWDNQKWTAPQRQTNKTLPSSKQDIEMPRLILPSFVPDPQRAFLRMYTTSKNPLLSE